MDERLEKALEFANYRTTIEAQRKAIKRRFKSMSIVHHSNGVFVADDKTICFVALMAENYDDAVVIDSKGNPIEIADLKDLYTQLKEAYLQATNEYYSEIKKLSLARSIKKALDW